MIPSWSRSLRVILTLWKFCCISHSGFAHSELSRDRAARHCEAGGMWPRPRTKLFVMSSKLASVRFPKFLRVIVCCGRQIPTFSWCSHKLLSACAAWKRHGMSEVQFAAAAAVHFGKGFQRLQEFPELRKAKIIRSRSRLQHLDLRLRFAERLLAWEETGGRFSQLPEQTEEAGKVGAVARDVESAGTTALVTLAASACPKPSRRNSGSMNPFKA